MAGLVPSGGFQFWSPEIARTKAMQQFLTSNAVASSLDHSPGTDEQFDWRRKALETANKASQVRFNNSVNSATQQSSGNYSLDALLRALRGQESGGNYGAVNRDSGALGAYQVMPSNLQGNRGWDFEALGRNVSTQEFLRNRALQEAIVRYKFNQYLTQHGPQGALSAWYSGDPNKWNDPTPQGNYPSVRNYVLQVLSGL